MDVLLAQPRGFCAGVVRAVDIVETALELYGPPVFVLHEIVHNQHVLNDLRGRGAVFVESLDDIPADAVTIFSAHGVAGNVVDHARERGLEIIDATCPLVTKVHLQAQRYSRQGYEIVIIGHRGHPEVEGTRGRIDGPVHVISDSGEVSSLTVTDPERIAYVTQTTLSVDDTRDIIAALRHRFPAIQGPSLDGICYATQNRQNAVHQLSQRVDLVLVVGARNSSNSNRLREVAEQAGVAAHLVQDAAELQPNWFSPDMTVGLTAGASAPEVLVQQVMDRLRNLGTVKVTEMESARETTTFRLPAALMKKMAATKAG